MKYTYQDMPDKSKEGVLRELQKGLAKIAVYAQTSKGFPVEMFSDFIKELNNDEKLFFYFNFRNKHLDLFK